MIRARCGYRSIKEPLELYLNEAKKTKLEILYSQKQTIALIHDLHAGLPEEDLGKMFFEEEKKSMEKLIEKLKTLNKTYCLRFCRLYPSSTAQKVALQPLSINFFRVAATI